MKTYTYTNRAPDWASQSRVVHSGAKMDGLNRWSVQLLRRRSRYGAKYGVAEKRGWTCSSASDACAARSARADASLLEHVELPGQRWSRTNEGEAENWYKRGRRWIREDVEPYDCTLSRRLGRHRRRRNLRDIGTADRTRHPDVTDWDSDAAAARSPRALRKGRRMSPRLLYLLTVGRRREDRTLTRAGAYLGACPCPTG
jgi:hypothetical protein